MDNQRRQQLVEQYEEIALSLLMDDYANEEGARLMKEFEEAQKNGEISEMPAELDEKCRKLIVKTFAKQERRVRLTRFGKTVAKAAVIVLVALGLLTTTVMSVDALRIPVLNFFIDQSGRFGAITIEQTTNEIESINRSVMTEFESSIPGGFYETQRINTEQFMSLCYADEFGNVISLDVVCGSDESVIDMENTDFTTVEINGYSAVYIKNDRYRLIWTGIDGDYIYTLGAKGIEESAFWELAYSIII